MMKFFHEKMWIQCECDMLPSSKAFTLLCFAARLQVVTGTQLEHERLGAHSYCLFPWLLQSSPFSLGLSKSHGPTRTGTRWHRPHVPPSSSFGLPWWGHIESSTASLAQLTAPTTRNQNTLPRRARGSRRPADRVCPSEATTQNRPGSFC